jgi:predicted Zn-dependent peptidase
MTRRARILLIVLPALAGWATPSTGQRPDPAPSANRELIERLTNERLDFEQPVVAQHEVSGVPVLVLEDHDLPLVTVAAYIRGGYGRFPRSRYGAAMGLPALLRYGGTEGRTPTEVDEALELYALQLSFGSSGGSINASVNTLTDHLPIALDLWGEMLARPRFDTLEVGAWRARQLESVRRRVDDPARLAYSGLNRLLFGDHPIGWETDEADLQPERLTPDIFLELHDRIVCRDNLFLGVTGDAEWASIEPLLDALVDRIEPCAEALPDPPVPEIRRAPGVFLIEKEIAQSVVVMAHPTSVRLADDTEYFAAMLGNSILGAGGFSSRMLGRVRTEEGFAYSATSIWTTPRTHDGIVGATTRTRPENAAPAIELILRTMAELREAPPTGEEVGTTVDRIVNGFVFNFDTPSAIVARTMYYLAQDMPEDWLERYWRGVQDVSPEDIRRVFAEHLRPDEMTILVVGDPDQLRNELTRFGPVTVLEVR